MGQSPAPQTVPLPNMAGPGGELPPPARWVRGCHRMSQAPARDTPARNTWAWFKTRCFWVTLRTICGPANVGRCKR
jgi:hypothetical protein